MNKIKFPRISYNGTIIERKDLEKWFFIEVSPRIIKRLLKISIQPNSIESKVLELIIKHLPNILLDNPKDLLKYTKLVDLHYNGVFHNAKGKTEFGKKIYNAFDYKYYRTETNVLVLLAEKLNVKACSYCNMNYTLFAEDNKIRLAKFQFDHFFDKSKYPFLSMSLYNLIPSCAVCNHGKSTGKVSLRFHPYDSDICDQFHFEANTPLTIFSGAKLDKDKIGINLIPDACTQQELDVFDNTFNIKTLYSRHRDIVQEVYDKAYEEPYYLNPSNFHFLNGKPSEYLQRLWMGTYTKKSEIEKRPMTKLIQDLWKQAKKQVERDEGFFI